MSNPSYRITIAALAVLLAVGLGLAACSSMARTPSPTATPEPTQAPPPTVEPTLTPEPTPTLTPTIAAPPAPAAGILGYHTVRPGETLSCIGRAYGVSPAAIAAQNGISESATLRVGQVLAIPNVRWTDAPLGPVCVPQFTVPPAISVTVPVPKVTLPALPPVTVTLP